MEEGEGASARTELERRLRCCSANDSSRVTGADWLLRQSRGGQAARGVARVGARHACSKSDAQAEATVERAQLGVREQSRNSRACRTEGGCWKERDRKAPLMEQERPPSRRTSEQTEPGAAHPPAGKRDTRAQHPLHGSLVECAAGACECLKAAQAADGGFGMKKPPALPFVCPTVCSAVNFQLQRANRHPAETTIL